ncbi:MAG: hypothetical protein A2X18_07670 [Bacteroidetes bacterium GWF2_40_14]|nr:MAG: hypothetical protein A2X18_07670 [Bacteroidetes bacterium GWF2_40_14]
MVSTKQYPDMSRTAVASCLKCEKLHTSCYSFIRRSILSPDVVVSDYARWGCIKYKGPGQLMHKNARIAVFEALKTGELLSVKRLTEALFLERQIILNNISRLKKKGVPVLKQIRNGEVYYQIAK